MSAEFFFKNRIIDAATLSKDELIYYKNEIEKDKREINESIRTLFDVKRHSGVKIDSAWLRDSVRKLEKYKDYIQMLLFEIRLRNKEYGRKHRPLAQYFVDTCRARLSSDLFDQLMADAKARREQDENTPTDM